MSEPSRLVSDQPIDEIAVAGVFRSDLGAVGELAESIAKLGLLSPVVVTEDRLLVSGGRRLAAVRALGWTTVPAWVAPKVSDRLSRVLAARDTDALHKRLTPVEQAELYAELEQLYAAEAGRRRQAGGPAGGPPDSPAAAAGGEAPARPPGRRAARAEAARAVTGADSHQRLEQINELKRIAADKAEHPLVRQGAADALMALNEDGVVGPRWEQVKLHQAAAAIERAALGPGEADEVRRAAFAAAEAVGAQPSGKDMLREARQAVADIAQTRQAATAAAAPPDPDAPARRAVRRLAEALRREHGWWDRCDPGLFARLADAGQWNLAAAHVAGADRWMAQAEAARR